MKNRTQKRSFIRTVDGRTCFSSKLDESRVIVLDFETTGLSPAHGSEVIEASAREFVNGNERGEFHTLMCPHSVIPRGITEYTGITSDMVQGAPSPELAMKELFRFIGDSPVVAHNASFEARFLQHYMDILSIDAEFELLCTMKLSRRTFRNQASYGLESIANALGIRSQERLHRASADTHVTARLFDKICHSLMMEYTGRSVGVQTLALVQQMPVRDFDVRMRLGCV